MLKNTMLCLVVLLSLGLMQQVSAQDPAPVVNRSTTIQVVDGKEYFFHAVQRGHTLFSIAQAYGVTQEEILQSNPEVREFGLRFDQLIRIPVKKDAGPRSGVYTQTLTQTTYTSHQVKRRETVYGISRQYGISMEELLEHNPEARTGLRANMLLRIPQQTQTQVNYFEIVVPPGQTLFSISREHGVSIDELNAMNAGLNEGLKAGQVLRIPTQQTTAQPPFVPDDTYAETPSPSDYLVDDPYCEAPQLKSHYNVALLIPLYLENINNEAHSLTDSRNPSFSFVDYYQGMMLALDSIRAMGYDIRMRVYDVCESTLKARTVLRNPEMAQMDLIIGPFYPETFEIAADFARARNIPIVSPLHWEDNKQLVKYPNMFQAAPSIQTQISKMALHVARTHENDNIILVQGNQPGVVDLVAGFKKALNTELNYRQYYRDSVNLSRIDGYYLNGVYVGERLTNVYVINDSLMTTRRGGRTGAYQEALNRYMSRDNITELVYTRTGMTDLRRKLDPTRRNVLVTLMGGEAIIPDYTRQLNQMRDTLDLIIYGVPQWRNYRAIDFRAMQNLKVHMYAHDFVEYEKQYNVDFIRKYRSENFTEPSTMAFSAVTTGMYFFSALAQYGSQFWRCTGRINESEAPASPLWFERASGEQTGWENQHVFIIFYENFRLRNVNESTSGR